MVNPLSNPAGNIATIWFYQAILVEMTGKILYGLCATQRHKEIRRIFSGGVWPLFRLCTTIDDVFHRDETEFFLYRGEVPDQLLLAEIVGCYIPWQIDCTVHSYIGYDYFGNDVQFTFKSTCFDVEQKYCYYCQIKFPKWQKVQSDYIPQYLWDVITCPCPWYLILAQHS